MKTTITFIFLLFIPISFFGQEFSFSLRFEDSAGNRDTLTFGYDSNATDGVDPLFGEENLHYKPFDQKLEARITKEYPFMYYGDTILLKKQIERKKCNTKEYPLIQMILIKCNHFPLKISWDPIFENECVRATLLTNQLPGGCSVSEYEYTFFLSDSAFINLPSLKNPYYDDYYIDYRGDSLQSLYFMLSSIENFNTMVGIPEIENYPLIIYPNPVTDILRINTDSGDIESVLIRDITGHIVINANNLSTIDTTTLSKGIYFVEVKFKHRSKPMISKILKI